MGIKPGDFVITKHQWGAFYGTELDLEFRRRGITTMVLRGIATNFGVESTARFAYEYGAIRFLRKTPCRPCRQKSISSPSPTYFPILAW